MEAGTLSSFLKNILQAVQPSANWRFALFLNTLKHMNQAKAEIF